MRKIGLLSDTHSFLHSKIFEYFAECDEIWHAGDIGNIKIADELNKFKPLKAVYGNADGQDVRIVYPQFQNFKCEECKVLMTHIGGYPGRYDAKVRELILAQKPNLLVVGHSHILKVFYDKKYNLLHVNPGACGNYGFHLVKTIVRFNIEGERIKNFEIIEIEKK
ncbi:MAG: metallophosphoesterase family protein [Bacteroidales bacterium]|nr:metallophosphoesterase family protein [Bacteroidales bacterium]